MYLAIVMDLYNREVLGYSVSQHIDSELVKRALGNAIARKGGLQGAVFHSDRGTQYNSESYQRMLRENGIRQSMSRAGCPYDNACSESFFATVKKDCIYLKNYATIDEVKADVFEYIDVLQQKTYAFVSGLYESGGIQAGTQCLKNKNIVPICSPDSQCQKNVAVQ